MNLLYVNGWDFISRFLWVLYGGSCCGRCGTGRSSSKGSLSPAGGEAVGWQFSILDVLGTASAEEHYPAWVHRGQLTALIAQAVVEILAPPSDSGQF